MHLRMTALILAASALLATPAKAIELNISPQALERTLNKQLFTESGRYYLRGKPGSACYAYAEDPEGKLQRRPRCRAREGTREAGHESARSMSSGVVLNTEKAMCRCFLTAWARRSGFAMRAWNILSASRELNFFPRTIPQQQAAGNR